MVGLFFTGPCCTLVVLLDNSSAPTPDHLTTIASTSSTHHNNSKATGSPPPWCVVRYTLPEPPPLTAKGRSKATIPFHTGASKLLILAELGGMGEFDISLPPKSIVLPCIFTAAFHSVATCFVSSDQSHLHPLTLAWSGFPCVLYSEMDVFWFSDPSHATCTRLAATGEPWGEHLLAMDNVHTEAINFGFFAIRMQASHSLRARCVLACCLCACCLCDCLPAGVLPVCLPPIDHTC